MDENIVQQIEDIEVEADRILAEANEHAARLGELFESKIAALRKEREEALHDRLSALKAKLCQETIARLGMIEENAKKQMARLESLDSEAARRALRLILERLGGNAACQ